MTADAEPASSVTASPAWPPLGHTIAGAAPLPGPLDGRAKRSLPLGRTGTPWLGPSRSSRSSSLGLVSNSPASCAVRGHARPDLGLEVRDQDSGPGFRARIPGQDSGQGFRAVHHEGNRRGRPASNPSQKLSGRGCRTQSEAVGARLSGFGTRFRARGRQTRAASTGLARLAEDPAHAALHIVRQYLEPVLIIILHLMGRGLVLRMCRGLRLCRRL